MIQGKIAHTIVIEVIGPGCSYCRDLFRRTCDVVAERDLDAEPVHVQDLKTVLRYIPFTPVLKVDGRIVHRGKRLPEKDKLWELILAVIDEGLERPEQSAEDCPGLSGGAAIQGRHEIS